MPPAPRTPRFAAAAYVFLDRDGVINRKLPEGKYITRWEDLELLPGVAAAVAALNRSGRKVIVVTNQRGVSLGRMNEAQLAEIHQGLRAKLAQDGATLDAIYHCPHGRDECNCRKPKTGMIEAAFRDFPGATAGNSILIGDSLSDIQCGRNAALATIFVESEGEEELRAADADAAKAIADAVVASLAHAVQLILG